MREGTEPTWSMFTANHELKCLYEKTRSKLMTSVVINLHFGSLRVQGFFIR